MTLDDYLDWRATVDDCTREDVVQTLVEASGVSRETILACATRRRPMSRIELARRVSHATQWAVSVDELCWKGNE